MRVLCFNVTGQKIECAPDCDFSGIVSNSQGYLHAKFRFSAEWKGCKKVAVFTGAGEPCPVPILGETCEIPAAALTGRTVQVYVEGRRAGYRIPTNTLEFKQRTGR